MADTLAPGQVKSAIPATASHMVIGVSAEARADIVEKAKQEINRRTRLANERASTAGTSETAQAIRAKVPLQLDDFIEATRNYNSWQAQIRRENHSGIPSFLPNDGPALRNFLAAPLNRARQTPNVEGWLNYMADCYGIHLPPPSTAQTYLPEWVRRYHTLVAGPTGTGKSELLKALAHHYVRHNSAAVVVLDPHGKLVREIARWSEFQGEASPRLVFITYDAEHQRCPVLNPFDVKGLPRHAYDRYAADFATVLGNATDQGFTPAMETLMTACCRVLLDYRPHGRPSTLRDLYRFLSPDPKNDAPDLLAAARRHPDAPVVDFFRAEFASGTMRSTKDGVRTRLSKLLMSSNAFFHMTCGPSTVDLINAVDSGAVVLFDLESMGNVAGDLFGKLLIAQLVAHAMRRPEDAETSCTPIHLFIDEAERFFTPMFLRLLEQTRKKGLHLTFAQQVAGKGYSGQELESLLINTNIKFQGPGGCPPRMLEKLNIGVDDYDQYFPEQKLDERLAGGDFLCKWGPRSKTIYLTVTRDVASNCVPQAKFAALLEHQRNKHYQPFATDAAGVAGDAPAEASDAKESEWTLR